MKNIKIILSGKGYTFLFGEIVDEESFDKDDSFWRMEDDGIINNIIESEIIINDVKIELDDRLIIKKGKYINTKKYFTEFIKNKSFVIGDDVEVNSTFEITLEDDEEFDPYKLQLVKTDYELDFLPYGIITDFIIYDGKKIHCCECDDYPYPNENWSSIIDYNLPYVQ